MLNIDLKIFSKSLAAKLKSVLPSHITSQQTANVQNRYVGEAGRSIFDILDICDKLSIDGYLVTVDIEKAFDSLDHEFLLVVLKNLAFIIISLTGSKYQLIRNPVLLMAVALHHILN